MTSFSDTRITGTVEAAKDCVFYTSIPYDKGWTVKIDGKEIDKDDYISLVEAYLSFNLPAGKSFRSGREALPRAPRYLL